jgi:hypothetical protein
VLVNAADAGYVNMAETVEDSAHANGRLDPINEEQLRTYLGYSSVSAMYTSTDGAGVSYNSTWHFHKLESGVIEIPLGLYYAIRREIPKENIVFLNGISSEERNLALSTGIMDNVVHQIKAHLNDRFHLSFSDQSR